MDFSELVKQRFSARKYTGQPVKRELLEKCIEAARLAPSASNSQPWHFVLVDEPELVKKVAAETWDRVLSFNKFAQSAAAIVVMVMEKPKVITQLGGRIKNKEYPLIDIGIAAEHFCLQATEEGLGTCMVGWFNEKPIKHLLNIPKNKTIGLLITVGYPNYNKQLQKKRKAFSEIVSYNSYK